MPDLPISGLTPIGTLVGTEELPSNAGGLDRKITIQQILDALSAGLQEIIDNRVAALLVQGTNITLTYSDAANTLTIDSGGTSNHSLLTNLDLDTHPQYFDETRGDARYVRSSSLASNVNFLVSSLLDPGTNVTLDYDSVLGSLTINAVGSVSSVNIQEPDNGINVSGGPITGAGTFTLSLANDLLALENLSGTGVPYRIDTDVWEMRPLPEPYVPPTPAPVPWFLNIGDETTAITTGLKYTNRAPYAFTLDEVRASLTTAQPSGAVFTVDVRVNGVSVFSTLLTIDNTERSSLTATSVAVISNPAVGNDDEITVRVTQVGTSGAAGLKVTLLHTPT